jgi:nitrate reductase delta subunit
MAQENFVELYDLFAHVLGPPGPSLSDRVNECISILAPSRWEAAGLMNRFKTFVEQTPISRMEEIYAETFSLQGVCCPYVGYHLFGDGSHRKLFLAGLEEEYRIYDFSSARELPDHLGMMLKFLVKDQDQEEREELISLRIIPGLKKLLSGSGDKNNPYRGVLQALLLVLQGGHEST